MKQNMKQNRDSKHASVNADLRKTYGETITRAQLFDYKKKTGIFAEWLQKGPEAHRVGRGLYAIPDASGTVAWLPGKSPKAAVPVAERLVPIAPDAPAPAPMTMSVQADVHQHDLDNATIEDKMASLAQGASLLSKVPAKNKTFVPFGDYDMLEQVIASRQFFPVYISGLSGNGKTFQVEQACSKLGREYVRANITLETDEDDLLGGFRLRDGNTVFEPGPAIVAMLRGAVLLLDEVDLASPKLLCLQPLMEGKSITLKKLGVTIDPAPGFTVIATANTKGRGDETGSFIGAVLLNEAFLERFPITIEQEYPSVSVEKKILAKHFEQAGFAMTPHSVTFFDTIARWAEAIRVTFTEGGVDYLVSTRRLCHIVRAYAIFGGDDAKALAYCVNRFDAKTKDMFQDLYNKLAPDAAGTPSNVGSLDGDEVVTPNF
jgi:MoxR-like ATPase